MSSLLNTIIKSYQRRKARSMLEKWKKTPKDSMDIAVSRKYEMADMFVDVYWYAVVKGQYRELMSRRHMLSDLKEQLTYDEEVAFPKRLSEFNS